MTTATRQEVLGLYRRIFRLARRWQAASGQVEDTAQEKQYIVEEARTLFRKNRNVSRPALRVARTTAVSCVCACFFCPNTEGPEAQPGQLAGCGGAEPRFPSSLVSGLGAAGT